MYIYAGRQPRDITNDNIMSALDERITNETLLLNKRIISYVIANFSHCSPNLAHPTKPRAETAIVATRLLVAPGVTSLVTTSLFHHHGLNRY